MNTYSKMTVFPKNKSRSVDFSHLSSFFDHPLNSTAGERPSRLSQLERGEEEEEDDDEKCRNSPSATAVIQCAVKRVLSASMRRSSSSSSSSSSQKYCRIHDQPATLRSPIEDDEGGGRRVKMRSEKKKARIIKACKSLLGL